MGGGATAGDWKSFFARCRGEGTRQRITNRRFRQGVDESEVANGKDLQDLAYKKAMYARESSYDVVRKIIHAPFLSRSDES